MHWPVLMPSLSGSVSNILDKILNKRRQDVLIPSRTSSLDKYQASDCNNGPGIQPLLSSWPFMHSQSMYAASCSCWHSTNPLQVYSERNALIQVQEQISRNPTSIQPSSAAAVVLQALQHSRGAKVMNMDSHGHNHGHSHGHGHGHGHGHSHGHSHSHSHSYSHSQGPRAHLHMHGTLKVSASFYNSIIHDGPPQY